MLKPPPPIAEGTPPLPPDKRIFVSEIRLIGQRAAYLVIEIKAHPYYRLIGLN